MLIVQFLLKHSFGGSPSVLTAIGASLEKARISPSARLVLIQKGAIQPQLTIALSIDDLVTQDLSEVKDWKKFQTEVSTERKQTYCSECQTCKLF
jgi:hypothetical protein